MTTKMSGDHAVIFDQAQNPVGIEFPPVFNVAAAFIDRHLVEGHGERIAIRTVAGDVTYAALAENVARAAHTLTSLGLRRGERMVMVVKDSPEFFYIFWGAVKAGIIPVVLNTLLHAPDYQFYLEDSGCAAAVFSPDFADELLAACDLASPAPCRACSTADIEAAMKHAPTTFAPEPTGPLEDCFWLYSSGSTGKAKGVVHVHRDMVVICQRYGIGIAGIRPDDVVFCAGKLFFSFGFGGGMTFPLWAGATTVLCDEKSSANMAFDMIERFRPTIYFAVPTLYAQQIHAMESQPHDVSSIRLALSAGEALPATVFEKWLNRTGITILDGIGSTEVLHVFVSNRPGDIRPGTSGRPVPGFEVKIVGKQDEELGPNEIGVLMVKAQSNARCYWNNPAKTATTMRGEWLYTGDMYYVDNDGYYTNAGRGDDMLKVGAMWCSPIEIENKLLEHPKVREAAVVGRPDDDGLVKPAAHIVLKNAADATDETVEDLKQHCKATLAGYKYPRWFTFINQLPKTSTGKIQRFRLRDALTHDHNDPK